MRLGLQSGHFPLLLYTSFISLMRVTCLATLILLHSVTKVTIRSGLQQYAANTEFHENPSVHVTCGKQALVSC